MQHSFTQEFISFLQEATTPFHATQALAKRLEAADFTYLDERDAWSISATGRFYSIRNGSSLIAVQKGRQNPITSGFRMVGAHTDSPGLRIKPNPDITHHHYWQLSVEVYGSALLAPWFDRDLSIAGRVTFYTQGKIMSCLVDFKKPIAVIPNLAIHLNREANQGRAINPQQELPVMLAHGTCANEGDFRGLLSQQLDQEHGIQAESILDYELSLYDTQSPSLVGVQKDFLCGARLDNLVSCYAGVQALLASNGQEPCVLICTDHEEIGSNSIAGAQGPLLPQTLRRLLHNEEDFVRSMQHSLLVSADNAHGVHPNYSDKHDPNHAPLLNAGPVIKINHNQRYATNSETAGFFRQLCQAQHIPAQTFATRSDMGCGSTIGPIVASQLGIRTLDIGIPTFAMHSIRETAGCHDLAYLMQALKAFYNAPLCF